MSRNGFDEQLVAAMVAKRAKAVKKSDPLPGNSKKTVYPAVLDRLRADLHDAIGAADADRVVDALQDLGVQAGTAAITKADAMGAVAAASALNGSSADAADFVRDWARAAHHDRTHPDAFIRRVPSHVNERNVGRMNAAAEKSSGSKGHVDTPVRVWEAVDMDKSRQIEWLAAQRLPAGSVCYMLGHEGIGKSLFLVWLTALLTTGQAAPEFGIPARQPQKVVWVITEDDWVMVARPRMELAGVDLEHVRVICADSDGSGAPEFPRDMDKVAEAVGDGAALVIVDAWADTLPGGLSVRDPQQARQALHPWKDMATRCGVSVLLSGHTNREKGANVRNAYGLTGELRKKARMTLLAQADEEEEGVLTIGPEKCNLAPSVAASKFRIEAVQVFEPTPTSDGKVPRLVWIGDATHSARELFAAAAEDEQDDRHERNAADAWLEDYLTMADGPVPSAEAIRAASKAAGISRRTVQRAAERLKVVVTSEGFPRCTMWRLPGDNLKPVGGLGGLRRAAAKKSGK